MMHDVRTVKYEVDLQTENYQLLDIKNEMGNGKKKYRQGTMK